MTTEEQILLATRMNPKSPTTAVVLAGFLGGFGAHKFYMQQYVQGTVYFLLSWTFIPMFFAFIELFLMPSRVRRWNAKQEAIIIEEIKSRR